MTLLRYDYYALGCNGKVDNLVDPLCQAKSEGVFSDFEALLAKAKEAGWTETANGKGHLCPMHRAAEQEPAKRPPKARKDLLEHVPTPDGS